ncbi:hypothetical protein SAV14893_010100 [Streptomyces avermitilis]|uniref:Uncharacterized protein n=1 Tax=Streptomyces avermitilis TaxID=33903 RepID=A0A4D4LTZ2_STRAX|nr:hypothetical protein SAV14893_010100 [Streptomyces avermitilis]
MRTDRQPPSVVPRRNGPYDQVTDLRPIAGRDLGEPQMTEPAQPRHLTHGAPRQQQPGAGGEPGQGRYVEVVGVQMRDERHVRDRRLGRGRCAPAAPQVRQAAREERVGENARSRVLDRAGGMPPPGDLHRHSLCLLRATPPEPTGRSRVGGETRR